MRNPKKAAAARERFKMRDDVYRQRQQFELPQHTEGTFYWDHAGIVRLLENGATPVSLNVYEDGRFRHTVEFNGARYIAVSRDEISYTMPRIRF